MELSSLNIKKFLISFPKKSHLEKISYTSQKSPNHFSVTASKIFPEKNFLYFPEKYIFTFRDDC